MARPLNRVSHCWLPLTTEVAMIVGNALVPSLIAIIVIEKRIHPIPVN